MGYLEGTQKAAHTIRNYQLDLFAFQDFIKEAYRGKPVKLHQINRTDIERYRDYLKEKGLKTNTRRRKILTVTQFLNYLAKRKKLESEIAKKLPAPHKIERVPFTVPWKSLLEVIQNLPSSSPIEERNKALLWTLAETGCLVSELTELRFENWHQTSPTVAWVTLGSKTTRSVPVSIPLFQLIHEMKQKCAPSPWLFHGFNRIRSLGSPITPRGVELLVKHYGSKLGFPELTPRIFRHSVILQWFMEGLPQTEIQNRLGLKTTYAFRSYEPLLDEGVPHIQL